MKCNHCLVEFFPAEERREIGEDKDGSWYVHFYKCPSCNRFNVFLVNAVTQLDARGRKVITAITGKTLVRPKGSSRPPCPSEVPVTFASDYYEACITLFDSPKASAALSRRCLQNLLREKVGVKKSDLAKEIQEAIDNGKLPSHVIEIIDAVRNIGNFAAHPIKSSSTGEIVDVEAEEAELNLDVLEALFDYYFVQPEIIKKKKDSLNKKLVDAGKNPLP